MDRLGIELPDIYGISAWQEPDGTYTNRWDPELYPWCYAATQRWIEAQTA